jgi:hypothetical protein
MAFPFFALPFRASRVTLDRYLSSDCPGQHAFDLAVAIGHLAMRRLTAGHALLMGQTLDIPDLPADCMGFAWAGDHAGRVRVVEFAAVSAHGMDTAGIEVERHLRYDANCVRISYEEPALLCLNTRTTPLLSFTQLTVGNKEKSFIRSFRLKLLHSLSGLSSEVFQEAACPQKPRSDRL